MATVDNLTISIKANADAAAKNIQKLSTAVKHLKDVSNMPDGLRQMREDMDYVAHGANKIDETKEATKRQGEAAEKSAKQNKKWAMALGRVAFYRLVRTAIKEVEQAFSVGMERYKEFSELMNNDYWKTLTSINVSTERFKNQLGSMMGELVNLIAPVLTAIINVFTVAIDKVTQFFAALQGKTKYNKASDLTGEMANNLANADKSAKKLKATLLGFDEINRLNDNTDNGKFSDWGALYEEADIDNNIIKVADTIREIGKAIDDNIIDPLTEIFFGTGKGHDSLENKVKIIGGILLGWTIGKSLLSSVAWLNGAGGLKGVLSKSTGIFNKLGEIAAIGSIVIAVSLGWEGIKKLTDNDPTNDLLGEVQTSLSGALGGAALGWIISGGSWSAAMTIGLPIGLAVGFGLAQMIKSTNGTLKDQIGALLSTSLGLAAVGGLTAGMGGLVLAFPVTLLLDIAVKTTTGESLIDNVIGSAVGVETGATVADYSKAEGILGLNDFQKGYMMGDNWLTGVFNGLGAVLGGLSDDLFGTNVRGDPNGVFGEYNAVVEEVKDFADSLKPKKSGKGLDMTFKTVAVAHANGGFPEDGLFFANHGELVGQFSNGRTAVANNAEIIEGIKQGVYEAMAMAGNSSGNVNVYLDGKKIAEQVTRRQWQTQRALGV